MLFDEKISETVSLSKVLDYFIEENESPSVILDFLKKYEQDLDDILPCSRLCLRIFSLDFVTRCSGEDINKIYRIIADGYVNTKIAFYLCWQILHSNISENIKNVFRSFVNSHNTKRTSIYHPYTGFIGAEAERYDSIWSDIDIDINGVVTLLNQLPLNKFERMIKTLDNSLWKMRFLQSDVFENLTIDRQWITVNGLVDLMSKGNDIDFFFRQILSSQSLNNELKYRIFEIAKSKRVNYYNYSYMSHGKFSCEGPNMLPSELKNAIDEMDTAAQFSIKMQLFGMDLYLEHAVMYLIKKDRTDILIDLVDFIEDELRDNFDIVDFLVYLKREFGGILNGNLV